MTQLHSDGVFLRREAIGRGYDDNDLRAAVRSGQIIRIRHGAYTLASVWDAANDLSRHQLRAHAVLRSHATPLAMSHTTAAVEHGLRLWEPDLSRVHVTCLNGGLARTTSDVVYHRGACRDSDLAATNGLLVVEPARAALEAASLAVPPAAVVILDAALGQGLADLDQLHATYRRIAHWPRSRRLQVALRLTRTGAESVGESLARYLMWQQHVPEPVLQYEVRNRSGRLIGRTDFAWPAHGVLGEFDGALKYGTLVPTGDTAERVVMREKVREDHLREATGWLMVRLVWSDLFRPSETGRRIHEQLRRGQRLIG